MPDALRLSGLRVFLQCIEFAILCRPDKAFTPHPAKMSPPQTRRTIYRFPILGGQRSSNSTLPSSFCCSSITSNPHRRCTCFSTSLRPRSSGARLCGM
ncbi:hypothetical protein NMECO18_02775 [Escherichia coli]|nr:hypothetical protein NMECO18_02775 [Escherichia coli]